HVTLGNGAKLSLAFRYEVVDADGAALGGRLDARFRLVDARLGAPVRHDDTEDTRCRNRHQHGPGGDAERVAVEASPPSFAATRGNRPLGGFHQPKRGRGGVDDPDLWWST